MFFSADSFVLFALLIVFTIVLTLLVHELIARVPITSFLLLNQRVKDKA